jgi:hypothetical protein
MPKKKSFIDKNASQTFAVVNRSRRDPALYAEGSSAHVLVPTVTGNVVKKERKERYSNATAPANLGRDPDQDLGELEPGRGAGLRTQDDFYNPKEWELASYGLSAGPQCTSPCMASTPALHTPPE